MPAVCQREPARTSAGGKGGGDDFRVLPTPSPRVSATCWVAGERWLGGFTPAAARVSLHTHSLSLPLFLSTYRLLGSVLTHRVHEALRLHNLHLLWDLQRRVRLWSHSPPRDYLSFQPSLTTCLSMPQPGTLGYTSRGSPNHVPNVNAAGPAVRIVVARSAPTPSPGIHSRLSLRSTACSPNVRTHFVSAAAAQPPARRI